MIFDHFWRLGGKGREASQKPKMLTGPPMRLNFAWTSAQEEKGTKER